MQGSFGYPLSSLGQEALAHRAIQTESSLKPEGQVAIHHQEGGGDSRRGDRPRNR
jgi:hypothetical protein